MRATIDIIAAVKASQPVTHEELRLSLLVMASVKYFLQKNLRELAAAVASDKTTNAKVYALHAGKLLDRMSEAFRADPVKWLGPANIPGNPEHDDFYRAAFKLLENVEKGMPDA